MLRREIEKPTESMWMYNLNASKGLVLDEIKPDEIYGADEDGYISFRRHSFERIHQGIFYTKEEALEHAREALIKKIKSLKKQLQKFEKMEF